MISAAHRRRFSLSPSGVEIAALDWGGNGPLLILHHANGFCAAVWGPVAEPLRKHYRVVAIDARGHGDSSKLDAEGAYRWECFGDDLIGVTEQLLQASGRRSVALVVGHSFGGTASLVAASKRPELFERLVLVDPVVPPPPSLREQVDGKKIGAVLSAGARRRRRVWDSLEQARNSWIERQFFASWDKRVLDLYLSEGLVRRADGRIELKCPPEIEALIFEEGAMLDLYGFARQVQLSVLILHAAIGSFPLEFHQALADVMREARLESVEAGHLLPMEHPGLVAEAILRFVELREERTGKE